MCRYEKMKSDLTPQRNPMEWICIVVYPMYWFQKGLLYNDVWVSNLPSLVKWYGVKSKKICEMT